MLSWVIETAIQKNVQIEYEQNYLGRKAAYEDVLFLIEDSLEIPM